MAVIISMVVYPKLRHLQSITVWFLVIFSLLKLCACFNVDTKFPIVFRGSEPNTYFGYSVALHNDGTRILAIITSPKENNKLTAANRASKALSIHKCSIDSQRCEDIVLENKGNVQLQDTAYSNIVYRQMVDDMWLGVSMDTRDSSENSVVVCGHLWKNTIDRRRAASYADGKSKPRPMGACYFLDRNLNNDTSVKYIPVLSTSEYDYRNIQRRRPDQRHLQPLFVEYGQAGMSVAFEEEGQSVIFGTPGLGGSWTGTAIRAEMRSLHSNYPFIYPGMTVQANAYLGYSVTSGKFHGEERYFASGAPKDQEYMGRVYTFPATARSSIRAHDELKGQQFGEGFGVSVLAVDIDNNGKAELLVGAPFFSTSNAGDQGRVYVYGTGAGQRLRKIDTLVGPQVEDAHFGMSLGKIGDINRDSYMDVAVGAPNEDDGHGVIYIYLGSKDGLKGRTYVQRIAARSLNSLNELKGHPLKGFGISFAKSMDVDSNGYPDILVGAYTSDQAVLLRSRPIISAIPLIKINVSRINYEKKECRFKNKGYACFQIQACLMYNGRSAPPEVEFLVNVTADENKVVKGERSRAFFVDENGNTGTRIHSKPLNAVRGSNNQNIRCLDHIVYVAERIEDYNSPIQVEMSYEIANSTGRIGADFCKTCPVLDEKTSTRTYTQNMAFLTGCRDDDVCYSDLEVSAEIRTRAGGDDSFVLGEKKVFSLLAKVTNKGPDPAYQPILKIALPHGMSIINSGGCHVEVTSLMNQTQRNFKCKLENPLRSNHVVEIEMKLEFRGELSAAVAQDKFDITFEAATESSETNPANNMVKMSRDIKRIASIRLLGGASTSEIMFNEKSQSFNLTHIYEVLKFSPSPVGWVKLEIRIPYKHMYSHKIYLATVKQTKIKADEESDFPTDNIDCTIHDDGQERPLWVTETPEIVDDEYKTINMVQTDDKSQSLPRSKRNSDANSNRPKPKPDNAQTETRAQVENSTSGSKEIPSNKKRYVLNCKTTVCLRITCNTGPFIESNSRVQLSIPIVLHVDMLMRLQKADEYQFISEANATIVDEAIRRSAPHPDIKLSDSAQVQTFLWSKMVDRQTIPLWIIAVSVGGGLLLLLLAIAGLLRIGFFRRSKKKQLRELKRRTLLQQQQNVQQVPENVAGEELDNQGFEDLNDDKK